MKIFKAHVSKALTKVLTINIELAALLCTPAVIMSHNWPVLPLQGATWIGFKFALESPDNSFTSKHCPVDVYYLLGKDRSKLWIGQTKIGTAENARVAVLSRG